jgi:4-amino-4-deoxy-L-arabinose transferase-like glycosyltransferase
MVKKKLKKYWLVFLFILVFLLRLPSLFEPFTYGDEGIYLTLGQAARKGLVFYRDIHDNKPPMLYLLAAIAGNFSAYRLIHFFWSFITIFVFYKLSITLFIKNKLAVIASTTAFAFLTSLHSFEGNVANAENFMLLPTLLAFYFLLKKKADKKILLLIGFLLGIATLFKVPAAFDFVALLILLFFFSEKKSFLLFIQNSLIAVFGFLFPILLSFVYYASQNAFNQYLIAAFSQNIPYLSSWAGGQSQASGLPLPLLIRSLAVFLLVLFLFVFRKKVSSAAKVILVWFGFSWFAALLSSRPYPHYLIQILPPLALSFGLFLVKQKKYRQEKLIPAVLTVILIATFLIFRFWYYVNLPYYANFYQYLLGIKNKQTYFADFDPRANDIYQVSEHLIVRTLPDEKIFIWGSDPFIYALTQRLPIGRYAASYHIIDFNGYQETITLLQEQKPRYLIVDPDEKRPFPSFFNLLKREYAFEKQIGDFKIYHRLL